MRQSRVLSRPRKVTRTMLAQYLFNFRCVPHEEQARILDLYRQHERGGDVSAERMLVHLMRQSKWIDPKRDAVIYGPKRQNTPT